MLTREIPNWSDLFWGRTEVQRRRALKDLSLRLPCRPLLRWFYMYFLLGGCLDDKAGFAWCTLQAFYEYLILLKVWELKQPQTSADRSVELARVTPTQEVCDRVDDKQVSGQKFSATLSR